MSSRNPVVVVRNVVVTTADVNPGAFVTAPDVGGLFAGAPPPGKLLLAITSGAVDDTQGTVTCRIVNVGSGLTVALFDITGFLGTPFLIHPVDHRLDIRHAGGGSTVNRVALLQWFDHT